MVRAVLGNALDDPGNFRSQFVVFFGVQNCGDLCAGRHFFLIFLLLKVKLDVLIRRPHWQDAEIYLLGERAVPRGIGFDIFGDARILALLSFSDRSEEHTSELQSLMRISYAVFCLKKKTYYIKAS